MKDSAQIPNVEALIARCLTEPEFLSRAVTDRDTLLHCVPEHLSNDARDLDFQKLWQFSGFIGKVQHNYLWEHFPMSRRLLAISGTEHAVFGEYRRIQLDPALAALDRQGRIRRFADFFERYSSEHDDELMSSVFRHERILWELRSGLSAMRETHCGECNWAGLPWREFQLAAAQLRPNVRVGVFRHDPLEAVDLIRVADSRSKLRIKRKRISLLYRLHEGSGLRIAKLDGVSAVMLSAASRSATVKALISRTRAMGLEDLRPRVFRELIEGAAAAGVLELKRRPCA